MTSSLNGLPISYSIYFIFPYATPVFLMQPQFTCRLTIIVIIIARAANFFLGIYLSINQACWEPARHPRRSASLIGVVDGVDAAVARGRWRGAPQICGRGGGRRDEAVSGGMASGHGGVGQALAAAGLPLDSISKSPSSPLLVWPPQSRRGRPPRDLTTSEGGQCQEEWPRATNPCRGTSPRCCGLPLTSTP